MKLGAAIPVLNEWRFIPAVAGQLLRIVDRCILLRGSRSFSGQPTGELSSLPELDPRLEVVEGNWGSPVQTRNSGIELLSDCDYIFMLDSDEILLDEDLEKLKDLCSSGVHKVISTKLFTYWKTPEYRIDPPEPGVVRVVVRKDVRMVRNRDVQVPIYESDIWMRHLSYVRTDKEVQEKMRLSGHLHEWRRDWYENVWKAWDRDRSLKNLHPVHPAAYGHAIRDEDSQLAEVLSRWKCR